MQPRPPGPPRSLGLPYFKPQLGRDYWIQDQMMPNALEIRERCLARSHWEMGLPYRKETWPGMRAADALLPEELERLEAWVKEKTGASRLWQERSEEGTTLNHNCVQLVAGKDSGPRPHTDSLKLCRYAAVLYLTPEAPPEAGTSFYRLRLPNGALSGNTCPPPHANLREALGIEGLPLQAWSEELAIPNVFNRFLLYRANLVHSARCYFGTEPATQRMTAVFFWMAA